MHVCSGEPRHRGGQRMEMKTWRGRELRVYLALFEHKIRDQNRLSPPEVQAVSAFLLTAVPEFAIFASVETVLKVCQVYCSHTLTFCRVTYP